MHETLGLVYFGHCTRFDTYNICKKKSAIKFVSLSRGVELGVAGVGMIHSFQRWLRIACPSI